MPDSPLHRFNQLPATPPDPEAVLFLHDVYKLIRGAPPSIGHWPRQRTFEAAADALFPWRVVAISEEAIRHVVTNRSAKGLARGHAVGRAERYDMLFGDQAEELGAQELVDFFFSHDMCAVVTSSENSIDGYGHWSPLYEVMAPNFQAGPGAFAVPVRQRIEVSWAVTLLGDIASGHAKPFWTTPPYASR
jgi:hypothetical protein